MTGLLLNSTEKHFVCCQAPNPKCTASLSLEKSPKENQARHSLGSVCGNSLPGQKVKDLAILLLTLKLLLRNRGAKDEAVAVLGTVYGCQVLK